MQPLPARPFEVDFRPLCACGARLGLHRFPDDACPNPRWRCGNGQPQWLQGEFVSASLLASTADQMAMQGRTG